jgi:hypothetical protein
MTSIEIHSQSDRKHPMKNMMYKRVVCKRFQKLNLTLHGNVLLDDSCQNTSGHAQENVKKVKN